MEPEQMNNDTIVAVSTATGVGGIAVIRLSGPKAITIVDSSWKGKRLVDCDSHTAHLGIIKNHNGEIIDQVVATIFIAPNSFTGEDIVEISCHGSTWIQREIVNEMVRRGARPAEPGEFTQRAFMNGRLDLAQAEGIADLIAASSQASHRLAMQQANGHFSAHLNNLREQLIEFASLLELELDFSEEEVEFADRKKLRQLSDKIIAVINKLAESYATGKAYKEGIPVVIAGEPNAGKSSLLNLLLEDDKAIVSDIPGTTRDIIEDTREINGILFRFIDTAGLRQTDDEIERMGIDRAEKRIGNASIVLWIIDTTKDSTTQLHTISDKAELLPSSVFQLILLNKSDLKYDFEISKLSSNTLTSPKDTYNSFLNIKTEKGDEIPVLKISAKTGTGIEVLKSLMSDHVRKTANPDTDIIVTNGRHYALLLKGLESLQRAREALDTNISADFIAQDVREALHHLGAITGTITTPDILASIFSRFCIGK